MTRGDTESQGGEQGSELGSVFWVLSRDRPGSEPSTCCPSCHTSGLDADGGQAGDRHLHRQERTSGDQKPGHPRVSAGKASVCQGHMGVTRGP